MTKPSEPRLTQGTAALEAVIEKKFNGNKREAARVASSKGFPATGEGAQYEALVYQTLLRMVNGHIHNPGLDRLLWVKNHWGVSLPLWSKPLK